LQGITGSGGQAPYDKARRPKSLKLLIRRALARIVVQKLRRFWSPEQIAGWLKCAYPNDESGQVSHETIYKSLFIQARGALKKRADPPSWKQTCDPSITACQPERRGAWEDHEYRFHLRCLPEQKASYSRAR
jgi:IS30 family transposase